MATRKKIITASGSARLTSTRVPFTDANGDLVDDADMTFATDTFTVAKVVASTSLKTAAVVNDTGLASGTYTPTLTGVTNVTATTARKCTYMRVGNTVTVAGQMDIDPAGIGLTVVGISLPVASNFGTAYECGGAGHTPTLAGHGASVYADATNDRAELSYIDSIGSNDVMTFTFTYEVI